MKCISNRIAVYRNNIAIRQEDLADKLDLSRTAVSNWEQGLYNPSPKMQLKLMEFFGATRQELFTYDCEV